MGNYEISRKACGLPKDLRLVLFQIFVQRVDKMFFPDAPFLVLEFSDRIEGPYEDADPFPYDLAAKEMEWEIENLLYDRK